MEIAALQPILSKSISVVIFLRCQKIGAKTEGIARYCLQQPFYCYSRIIGDLIDKEFKK
ncbi:hypothetical protein IWX83_000915 [Flavobacterium sp. CG_9.1]|uniref:hypothetical protein n=1 Tax=Flavobacterium sp. CG_9.1 TaxID=2787728 RepID=UPI0018CA12EF|nr:hypothetical protein [Flavobacterium sp. CG_9.1]MBG6061139.1 hypothetical protein [Flavobacterium sp. CG_9.1]